MADEVQAAPPLGGGGDGGTMRNLVPLDEAVARERAEERRRADPAAGCKWVLSKGEREGACGRVVGSTVLCRFVDFGGDGMVVPVEKRHLAATEPVDLSSIGQAVSLSKDGMLTGGRIEACGVGKYLIKLDDTGGCEWHPHAAVTIATQMQAGVWIS